MANTLDGQGTPRAPLDLSHHFSQITKRRLASQVKSLYKYTSMPGLHNMSGGLPHQAYFPFDTLEASAARFDRFRPLDQSKANGAKPAEWHLSIPKIKDTPDVNEKIDLESALQYGTVQGYPPLYSFVREFVRNHLHPNVPYTDGPDVVLSCGATDGMGKAIEALTNAWDEKKDWVQNKEGIIFEEFAYMTAVQTVQPRGLNIATVAVDAEGMKATGPGSLEDVLSNWDFRKGKRPHLMYTVTLGHNPTGSTTTIERRKELYSLCQTYDIIIIEDEPYWSLQYPSLRDTASKYRGDVVRRDSYNKNYNSQGRSSGYQFLDSLCPSFLSIDVDGRVVRLDTFSKTIAPGCRLGWITSQPAIIERITRIAEASTQQPSGFVQVMVAQLLEQQGSAVAQKADKEGSGWKIDGWVHWLEGLRDAYQHRVHEMCMILEEGKTVAIDGPPGARASGGLDSWSVISKVPMYEFNWPMAGMFVWVRVRYDTHPLVGIYGAEKVCAALWFFLLQKPFQCVVSPGLMFAPSEASRGRAFQFLRLCFAPMAEDEVAGITRRFVAGCRAFWQVENFDDIPGLDEPLPETMGAQMC